MEREIKRQGQIFTFYRDKKNDYGGSTGEYEKVCDVQGLYHEYNTFGLYQTAYVRDGVRQRQEKQPMVMCLMEEARDKGIQMGDFIFVSNEVITGATEKYAVTGINDICDWGIIADISLEVIDDGTVS